MTANSTEYVYRVRASIDGVKCWRIPVIKRGLSRVWVPRCEATDFRKVVEDYQVSDSAAGALDLYRAGLALALARREAEIAQIREWMAADPAVEDAPHKDAGL